MASHSRPRDWWTVRDGNAGYGETNRTGPWTHQGARKAALAWVRAVTPLPFRDLLLSLARTSDAQR